MVPAALFFPARVRIVGLVMKTYLAYGAALALAGLALHVVLYLLGLHTDVSKFTLAQIVGGVCSAWD